MTVAVVLFLTMLMFPPFALAAVSTWMFCSPRLRLIRRVHRSRTPLLVLISAIGGAVGVESFWDASEHVGFLGEAGFAVICVTFALSGVSTSVRVREVDQQATQDLARERLHAGEHKHFGRVPT